MPLRCLDESGHDIHAFQLDAERWAALKTANSQRKHLRMPCCDNAVVLKTSKLGTFFFAHQRRGPCTTKPETEDHLTLKTLVCQALTKAGWDVSTEVRGQTPDGQVWVADVMASRGAARFAVEIQWSRQSDEETRFRQERYRGAGIKALWLFRQEAFPNEESIPAARVARMDDGSYEVNFTRHEMHHYPDYPYQVPCYFKASVSIDEFIRGVCARRFWFGVYRAGDMLTASYLGAFIKCWKCDAWTNVVSKVLLSADWGQPVHAELDSFARYSELVRLLPLDRLKHFKVGAINQRYSKAEGGAYLSNGCIACGALQGKFFLHQIHHRLKLICTHQVTVTSELERMLKDGEYMLAEPQWHLTHPQTQMLHEHHRCENECSTADSKS